MATSQVQLQSMLSNGQLWQGRKHRDSSLAIESTSWKILDDLIGGGWPRAAISEIISTDNYGLALLLPVLVKLSKQAHWIALISPPHIPFAPSLSAHGVDMQRLLIVQEENTKERLWAIEQTLKSGSCSAVLAWPGAITLPQLRRLQLAAEKGNCLGVLFRSARESRESSPAAMRLKVSPSPMGLDINVVKRRHGWGGSHCCIKL